MNADHVSVENLPVTDTEVLIVGAGPTGLMAGVVLARRGISAVVIDRKAGPTRESRALAVQARTMEIYDQLGLAEKVLAGAFPATRLQIGGGPTGGGPDIGRIQAGATRFPGVQIFEQSRNEELLADTLMATGGDIRWRHRLIDLIDRTDQPDGRVEALLEGEGGTLCRVRSRWCIGADGASSVVRRELNLAFEGTTDRATFWVADVRDVCGVPESAVNIRFGEATFAVAFPLGPDGHTRFVGLAARDEIAEDEALAGVDAEFGLTHGAVDWFSAYHVHHRVASKFRVGSIFLAGDAGHVHSPVGGQGMNTGLQDAHNLAMLLADVAQGRVAPQALDRYERERRPVALTLVNVTDRAFGVIGRRGRFPALFRRSVSSVAAKAIPPLTRTPLGPRIGGYLGQYRIHYHYIDDDKQLPVWAEDPVVGRRLPPVERNQPALATMTWQFHAYGVGELLRPEAPAWVEGPHVFGADPRGRLRSDRIYLVRPDGFVAASIPLQANRADADAVKAAMAAHWLVL